MMAAGALFFGFQQNVSAQSGDFRNPDTKGLPPRTVMEAVPLRPVPDWLRANLRVGHLPPAGWRMVDEYAKAGYNVITVNALNKWDVVGPSASIYTEAQVKEAD